MGTGSDVVTTWGCPSGSAVTIVVCTTVVPITWPSGDCPAESVEPQGTAMMETGSHCAAHVRSYRL